VEVRVGQAGGRGVGIVEELGVGFQDALDEKGIVGLDCTVQSL
jgi:hypothetical protein